MVGDGWYNQCIVWGGLMGYGDPCLLCQIVVEYEDGTSDVLVTDETWRAADGPVRSSNLYGGEVYDAREEIPGWSVAKFDDTDWDAVRLVESPCERLESQMIQPIKSMRTIRPVSINEPKPGMFVYDMGQNFAGWVKLTVEAPAGTTITMRSAEILFRDGTIDPTSTGVKAT